MTVVSSTHIIKRLGPGPDLSRTVQTPQQSVAQYVDCHGEGVNSGAVEGNTVPEALRTHRRQRVEERRAPPLHEALSGGPPPRALWVELQLELTSHASSPH